MIINKKIISTLKRKKMKNSFGIILDDIFAGIFATIFMYIILSWI